MSWQSFNLNSVLPGASLAPAVNSLLQAIQTLEQANTLVLQILQTGVLPNDPALLAIQASLAALQALLNNIFSDAANASVSTLFALPTSIEELPLYARGFEGWRNTVVGSFYDVGDLERPQISSAGTAGALALLITSPNALSFLNQLSNLTGFFNLPLTARIPSAQALSIVPCDADGNAIREPELVLDGTVTPAGLLFSWEEPFIGQSLLNIFQGAEVYVERSRSRLGDVRPALPQAPSQRNTDRNDSGRVPTPSTNEDPSDPGASALSGVPIEGWEPLDPVNPANGSFFSSGLSVGQINPGALPGQFKLALIGNQYLGSDNAYYYRIRVVPADVSVRRKPADEGGNWELFKQTGGATYTDSLPSLPALGLAPNPPDGQVFNFTDAFLNIYRAAYLLRFDINQPLFDSNQNTLPGPGILRTPVPLGLLSRSEFTPPSPVNNPDVKSLTASALIPGGAFPTVEESRADARDPGVALLQAFDPFAGQEEFFQDLTGASASTLFRRFSDRQAFIFLKNISAKIAQQTGLRETFRITYQAVEPQIKALLSNPLNAASFENRPLRFALVSLLGAVQGLESVGQPPDWTSFRLLSDGLPLVNTYLDVITSIITSINAYVQASSLIISDATNFLNSRLNALNNLSIALQNIIDIFTAFNQNVALLYIPPTQGGTDRVVAEFLSAANPPQTGPQDYTAGVVFFLGGPSAQSIGALLSLLFGV